MNDINKLTVEEYLNLPYSIVVKKDTEGDFMIEVPELPGCFSSASCSEDVMPNAYDAMKCWITACLADNTPIPLPAKAS